MNVTKDTVQLKILDSEGYRNLIYKMLEEVIDSDILRFYCILIHDYSQLEYPE